MMSHMVGNLTRDTKAHNAYTVGLIERYTTVDGSAEPPKPILPFRKVEDPGKRLDFLTRTIKDRDTNKKGSVQIATHTSDFM